MAIRRMWLVALLALVLVPGIAGAQQTQQLQTVEERTNQDAFVPFIGYNAGGGLLDAISQGGLSITKPKSYGASILFWGPGLLAGELDFGYNPGFFDDFNLTKVGASNNLTTLTLNFVLGPTFFIGENMRIRPYGLIGGGLMRSKIDEFVQHLSFSDTQNFGVVDIGAGVYFYPIKRIGVRGDVRYFRGVGANDSEKGYGLLDWNVYRISVGLAIAF